MDFYMISVIGVVWHYWLGVILSIMGIAVILAVGILYLKVVQSSKFPKRQYDNKD